ncbi:MAG: YidC/Oxa1 family membrane protein insertase [Clostridiaceae bacterium]|nr:YidC/Oxa1 family membrane protein insertase [Clostridiaceae bacterium]
MSAIFGIIATPLGYVMEYIYKLLENYGYSIIAFALLAKFVMLPISIKQKKSMIATQRISPKLRELQKKYGNDKEKYTKEVQQLYDDYGASPMGGCGTSLLTLPIMLGLYYVVTMPLTYFMHISADEISALASALGVATNKFGYQLTMAGMFSEHLETLKAISSKVIPVDFTFYGLNLASTPSFKELSFMWVIPILSALTSWGFSYVTNTMNQAASGVKSGNPDDEKAQQMNKSMMIMMPLMSGYFGFVLPTAVGIYWIANNLFGCVQEVVLTKYCLDKEKKDQELYKTGGKK